MNGEGHSFWFAGTSATIINTMAWVPIVMQPIEGCQLTQFKVRVWTTPVAGSSLSVALYEVDPITSIPTTKVADIMTAIDCSTAGIKTVSGLSIPLTGGTLYGVAFGGGAVAPTVYGTGGLIPAQSRGSLGMDNDIGDNLSRWQSFRFIPSAPGVMDDAPVWAPVGSIAVPNFHIKLGPP
jgi:hypothetical protein